MEEWREGEEKEREGELLVVVTEAGNRCERPIVTFQT